MSNSTLDPVFAAAVERELSAIGTKGSRLQRQQRRVRGIALGFGSVALVGALTGAAILVATLPGTTTTTPIGEVVSGSYVGTATIDLGPVPAHAGAVILDITCTEGGNIEVPTGRDVQTGATWNCSNPIRNDTVHIEDGRLPSDGLFTVTADAGTAWTIKAQYASAVTSAWKVNANGQTYGVPNESGVPDLSAAQATNGEVGYILQDELWGFTGDKGFINVYESDGTTVIGQFPIGDN